MCASPIYGNHTMQVQFGDFCYALICHDAEVFDRLNKLYGIFRSDKPADVSIKLEVVDNLDLAEVEAILSQMRIVQQGNHLVARNPAVNIEFDAVSSTFAVTADRCLFDPSLKFGLMNRLFRAAYYTVSRSKHQGRLPGMLVHSCGILRNGQVLLFAGFSETGKTTIGRLCREDYGRLLNDEMMLLSWPHPNDHCLWVRGVPILSESPFRLNTSAPLACVMLLKQSKRIAVRRLDRKEAYLSFMHHIINPAYFEQTDSRAILSLIAEFTDEVTKVTPFYELEFTLDKNLLWEVEAKLTELNLTEKENDGRSDNAG
jgi:hypothetical protein